jgi:hypothetical protein
MSLSPTESNEPIEVSNITKEEFWESNEDTIPSATFSVFDVDPLKTNSALPPFTGKHETHSEINDWKEAIDNTPISSVSETRKLFCKNTKPLFPKLNSFSSSLSKQQNSKSDSSLYENSLIENPCHAPSIRLADLQNETLTSPEMPSDKESNATDIQNSLTALSDEEFQDLARRKGCAAALQYFCYPLTISVIVKSFTSTDDTFHVIKNVNLQFHMKKRLVIMNRGKLSRYISLEKMYKIDNNAKTLDGFNKIIKNLSWINKKHYLVALYFHATPYPIYFVFKDIAARNSFSQLIIFLHDNSTIGDPLEVVE